MQKASQVGSIVRKSFFSRISNRISASAAEQRPATRANACLRPTHAPTSKASSIVLCVSMYRSLQKRKTGTGVPVVLRRIKSLQGENGYFSTRLRHNPGELRRGFYPQSEHSRRRQNTDPQ